MRHNGTARPPVPVRFTRRNVHDVPDTQTLRLLALRADQSRSHRDGEDLPALVRVPECAGL